MLLWSIDCIFLSERFNVDQIQSDSENPFKALPSIDVVASDYRVTRSQVNADVLTALSPYLRHLDADVNTAVKDYKSTTGRISEERQTQINKKNIVARFNNLITVVKYTGKYSPQILESRKLKFV